MDRHITSNFKIPAGSFGVFITLEVFITAGVYDCILFPLTSKIRGKQVIISAKKRIGIGIFFLLSGLGSFSNGGISKEKKSNSRRLY
jgi:peptide/histidine transporter 3/4